ncbi:hypothetical protein HZS55_04510 [Halosimplex rubrum]|uniref:Uncharacterized protein n=1 Tax=Halosimplex rubrum TaxID=869889 RepID=A0A7D5SWJ1_9EURY|nr:hypothetical protein [Halosimplex rubrum]QLH76611.1 hypothetical protein HZS55_04510 [Halosimplex rubrum]
MSADADHFPRDPRRTLLVDNVRVATEVDFLVPPAEAFATVEWIDERAETDDGFGAAVRELDDEGLVRFYTSGMVDCIDVDDPVGACTALGSVVERLRESGVVGGRRYDRRISNMSARAVLGVPVRLNRLYHVLPVPKGDVQPPDEGSNSLDVVVESDAVPTERYNDERDLDSMTMRVSVFGTGTIQIKGARHPDMLEWAVSLVAESVTPECLGADAR